jgi:hypothetical protein
MGFVIAGIALLLSLLTLSQFAMAAVRDAEVAHSTGKDRP